DMLYRIYREGDPVLFRPSPKKYRFRDISYVDYNADKIRNIYMTMLYANGIQAERMNLIQQALEYYDYAASFFPPLPELVSSHREGKYLWNRKREVDRARERLRK
ncbi:MAG: hypothetical protein JRI43_00920, partial [Deltaproteobacteria bacterium]|nr:hypothetical protein [Deltaproteobacteria bacterium]